MSRKNICSVYEYMSIGLPRPRYLPSSGGVQRSDFTASFAPRIGNKEKESPPKRERESKKEKREKKIGGCLG